MNWTVIVAGQPPDDLAAICDAARTEGETIPLDLAAADRLRGLADGEGAVVVGSDADLARAAAAVGTRGSPLALVPTDRSDLLRMFGLDRAAAIARIGTGSPYRCDLGRFFMGGVMRPFVAHVAAGPSLMTRLIGRAAQLVVDTPARRHEIGARRILVCNAQHVAGRTIAPKASVADGRFDIQAFAGSRWRTLETTRRSRYGLHLRDQGVWRRTAAAADIQIPPGWSVRVDGAAAGTGPFRVSAEKGAFGLWV